MVGLTWFVLFRKVQPQEGVYADIKQGVVTEENRELGENVYKVLKEYLKRYDLEVYTPVITKEQENGSTLLSFFNLDVDDLQGFVLYTDVTKSTPVSVAIVKPKTNSEIRVVKSLCRSVEMLQESFKTTIYTDMCKNVVLDKYKDYYILVVGENNVGLYAQLCTLVNSLEIK